MAVIAVDARELVGRRTGVGRYLLELLRQWSGDGGNQPESDVALAAARHRFLLYSHAPLPADIPFRRHGIVLSGDGGTVWEQTAFARALRRDRPDVLFAPAGTAPLLMTTSLVVAIHDLSYMAHPEWFRWREGARRRLSTRLAARKASAVLTGSIFSASEIVERLGVPPDRVHVTYYGGPTPDNAEGESKERLVLFVGSIFNRRRLPDLIRGFSRVVQRLPDARLVIVGENRTYPAESPEALAKSLGIAERVEIRGYASDDEVASLYARASVFVFISEYEGFGFTPLEAMARGAAVVVADTPLSREIYGPAAARVALGDVTALTEAMATLLEQPDRRRALASLGRNAVAGYSWDRTAAETLLVLERATRA
jgi:glycosyltransferase involved in cell wall biosynthesis